MGFLQDLPLTLGQALGFPVSTAQYTGGMILSMAVLAMVGLAFSAILGKGRRTENSNMIFTSMTLFVTMGALFLIGWMPFMFLVIAIVLVGVLFSATIKKGLGG
jgi:ABC-type multidrug transport system permease subunit